MVSLREWETRGPDKDRSLAQQSLDGFPAGRRLAEELSKTGRIEVLELARPRIARDIVCRADFARSNHGNHSSQNHWRAAPAYFVTPTACATSIFTAWWISLPLRGASRIFSFTS